MFLFLKFSVLMEVLRLAFPLIGKQRGISRFKDFDITNVSLFVYKGEEKELLSIG